jgi:hypothetical protein
MKKVNSFFPLHFFPLVLYTHIYIYHLFSFMYGCFLFSCLWLMYVFHLWVCVGGFFWVVVGESFWYLLCFLQLWVLNFILWFLTYKALWDIRKCEPVAVSLCFFLVKVWLRFHYLIIWLDFFSSRPGLCLSFSLKVIGFLSESLDMMRISKHTWSSFGVLFNLTTFFMQEMMDFTLIIRSCGTHILLCRLFWRQDKRYQEMSSSLRSFKVKWERNISWGLIDRKGGLTCYCAHNTLRGSLYVMLQKQEAMEQDLCIL